MVCQYISFKPVPDPCYVSLDSPFNKLHTVLLISTGEPEERFSTVFNYCCSTKVTIKLIATAEPFQNCIQLKILNDRLRTVYCANPIGWITVRCCA